MAALLMAPVLVASALASPAQAQSGKDLLLRTWQLKSSAEDAGSPESRFYDEILLFRDGLVLFVANKEDGSSRTVRAQVGDVALESLKALLVDEHVDTQTGYCDVTGVGGALEGSQTVSSRQTLLTWYGIRGKRVRHLPIGHGESTVGQFGEPCSAGLSLILSQTLAAAEASLTGPTATTSPDENYPSSLLFEVRNSLNEDPDCGDGGFVDDFHIFRDGLLIRRFLNAEGQYVISRAAVPALLRRQMNETLTQEQIASLRGACRTWFFVPFVVDGGCLDYAWESSAEWNGRGGRRGLVAGNDGVDATCSTGRSRIRNQLMTMILNALSFVTVETVDGRLPAVSVVTPRP
jgi:hypothetical protein